MSYRQLLANLEALPEGERQLAGGRYVFRTWYGFRVCGCVLGKGVPALRHPGGGNQTKTILSARFTGVDLIGMGPYEAREAQKENDGFAAAGREPRDFPNDSATRRARYSHMIEWLRARVSEESEAPQAL